MTAKEYNIRLREKEREIRKKAGQLEYLRELASAPTVPVLSGMPGTQSVGSPVERSVERAMLLEEELRTCEKALMELKLELLSEIGKVDDIQSQKVLIFRLAEGMSWDKISEKVNFSVRWVHRLYGKAAAELDEVLNGAGARERIG